MCRADGQVTAVDAGQQHFDVQFSNITDTKGYKLASAVSLQQKEKFEWMTGEELIKRSLDAIIKYVLNSCADMMLLIL